MFEWNKSRLQLTHPPHWKEKLYWKSRICVTRSGKLVLKDIDLEIKTGEFVGLVGPNGSGKSTLMLSILGILKAQKGTVRIYGSPPMSRNQIGKIGWVSQAAANLKKKFV